MNVSAPRCSYTNDHTSLGNKFHGLCYRSAGFGIIQEEGTTYLCEIHVRPWADDNDYPLHVLLGIGGEAWERVTKSRLANSSG